MDHCVHRSLGFCYYEQFKPGDLVQISYWGWAAGLAVNYAYTFGRVVAFDKGILTVRREGLDRDQVFHPCYWTRITEEEVANLKKAEYQHFWLDHCPDTADDLQME